MENLTGTGDNTTNQTTDIGCLNTINRDATRIGFTIAYCVVFVIAIVGNSLTIYIVRTHKDMPKVPFNYLIINMAVADIIDALFAVPQTVVYMYIQNTWFPGLLGEITCKLITFGAVISIAASVATLMIMAIDRFRAIVCSLKKPLTIREVKACIAFIWIISGGIFSTELYRYSVFLNPHVENNEDWYICSPDYRPGGLWTGDDSKRDAVIKFVLVYAIPLLTMVVFYSVIMFYMWRRTLPGELSRTYQKRRETQKRKVITMLITIVTVFAVCWIGVHVIHFLNGFSEILKECLIPEAVFMFLFWFSHANAAINPCIYFIFIRNFRNGLAMIFKVPQRDGIQILGFTSSTRSSHRETVSIHMPFSHHVASSPKLLRVVRDKENGFNPIATPDTTVHALSNSTSDTTANALSNSTLDTRVDALSNSTLDTTVHALSSRTLDTTVHALSNSTPDTTTHALSNPTPYSTTHALSNSTPDTTTHALSNSTAVAKLQALSTSTLETKLQASRSSPQANELHAVPVDELDSEYDTSGQEKLGENDTRM